MILPNASLVLGPIVIDGVPGSHWNVARSHMTPDLQAHEVMPATPAVVWAGDEYDGSAWRDTAFLVFPDDASALQALLAAGLAMESGNGV